jgi:hypothetical protein
MVDPVQLFPGLMLDFKHRNPWCDFYDVIHLLIIAAMYASYRSCLAQE